MCEMYEVNEMSLPTPPPKPAIQLQLASSVSLDIPYTDIMWNQRIWMGSWVAAATRFECSCPLMFLLSSTVWPSLVEQLATITRIMCWMCRVQEEGAYCLRKDVRVWSRMASRVFSLASGQYMDNLYTYHQMARHGSWDSLDQKHIYSLSTRVYEICMCPRIHGFHSLAVRYKQFTQFLVIVLISNAAKHHWNM